MAFDPTLPFAHSEITSAELRNQFTGLKDLIDAVPAPGPEADPVFAASEAALLVPEDKAKLDAAVQTSSSANLQDLTLAGDLNVNHISISYSTNQTGAFIDGALIITDLRIGNDAHTGSSFNSIAQGNAVAPATLADAATLAAFNDLLANLRAMKILGA